MTKVGTRPTLTRRRGTINGDSSDDPCTSIDRASHTLSFSEVVVVVLLLVQHRLQARRLVAEEAPTKVRDTAQS